MDSGQAELGTFCNASKICLIRNHKGTEKNNVFIRQNGPIIPPSSSEQKCPSIKKEEYDDQNGHNSLCPVDESDSDKV